MKVKTVASLSSVPVEARLATQSLVNNHQRAMRRAMLIYVTETCVGLPNVIDRYMNFLYSSKNLIEALLECDDFEDALEKSLAHSYPDVEL
jgi:hypothetical protein